MGATEEYDEEIYSKFCDVMYNELYFPYGCDEEEARRICIKAIPCCTSLMGATHTLYMW